MRTAIRQEERDAAIFGLHDLEIRQSGNGRDWTLTGLAAVFGQLSEPLVTPFGRFREKIEPGAFSEALARKPDVRLLFNHDENFVLGRTTSGTLELDETDQGLRVWARVAPTQWGLDLRESMQRGDVDQMSFAFTVDEDEWEDKDDGAVIRTINKIERLYDVSVVTFAAYPQTTAAARSMERALASGAITIRKVIPYRETPKAPESTPWDAGAEVARADTDDLRAMCTWCDMSGDVEDGWPTSKGAYKLPHHRSDGSHPVVWRGVVAAMNSLLRPAGAPRAVSIPAADRRGVYNHLASHYRQFDREAPEFSRALRYGELATEDVLDPELFDEFDELHRALGFDELPETTVQVSNSGRTIVTTNSAASSDWSEDAGTDAPDDPGVEERNAARDDPADGPRRHHLAVSKIDVRRRAATLTARIGRSRDGGEASGAT